MLLGPKSNNVDYEGIDSHKDPTSFLGESVVLFTFMADRSTRKRVSAELDSAHFGWFHIKAILIAGVG
jgi:hypothetical protein